MNDLIPRQAALDAVLKARTEAGPISTWVYDLIEQIPAESTTPASMNAQINGLRQEGDGL